VCIFFPPILLPSVLALFLTGLFFSEFLPFFLAVKVRLGSSSQSTVSFFLLLLKRASSGSSGSPAVSAPILQADGPDRPRRPLRRRPTFGPFFFFETSFPPLPLLFSPDKALC